VNVPKQHLSIGLDCIEHVGVREVATLAVRDRHPERATRADEHREGRVEPLGRDRDLAAYEAETAVPEQCAGHEARLGEHLEAVADAEDESAVARIRIDRAHHRTEAGDDAGADVVAVREPARQDDRVDVLQIAGFVPQRHRLAAGDMDGVDRVDVAVAARKDDDADPGGHAVISSGVNMDDAAESSSTAYTSISGFDNNSEASRSTTARAAVSCSASTVSSTRRPTRTSVTPSTPRCPRLPSTARPCGSRMPGFGVTLTANRKLRAVIR
jgi:hypothetical protein